MSVVFMFGVSISGILLADFVAWSASSFPFIPEWPGIRIILILGACCVISDRILLG